MHLFRPGLLALALLGARVPAATTAYPGVAGPYPVETLAQTWHDAKRDRDVPVKIYYPVPAAAGPRGTFPVIIFSHGLGGSREGYGYLGQCWASCGYVSVHAQHAGSDRAAIVGAHPLQNFREAAGDPTNAVNRPLDISFAIDRLTALNGDATFPLQHQLDLNRLGVAGHSFGAFTTMAIVGARIPVLGSTPRFLDPRVKAAIAMSTPANPASDTDAAFEAVKVPVSHMTGTRDELPGEARPNDHAVVGDTKAAQRLLPYEHTRHPPACLLVFTGGDHMVFSGRLAGTRPGDREFQALVCSGSVAFWDAWLKGDVAAKTWLENGGFRQALGDLGTFSHKP